MKQVEIKPHEIHALSEIVINVRAIADTFKTDSPAYAAKLAAWAGMIEELVERIESA